MQLWPSYRFFCRDKEVQRSLSDCVADERITQKRGERIMMTYQELLLNRRAIRDFQEKDVPLTIINEIIKESGLAPSASNGQPCRFIIVHNKKIMKKISDENKKNLLEDFARNPTSLSKSYEAILKDEKFNVFYNAPCVIYIVGAKDVRSLDVDCALTVAYIMFAATQRGLGTCWIGLAAHVRDPQTKAEMGIPDDCRIVAPVIIGYPRAIPPAADRKEPQILKIIS
jgi:nitroreductase